MPQHAVHLRLQAMLQQKQSSSMACPCGLYEWVQIIDTWIGICHVALTEVKVHAT